MEISLNRDGEKLTICVAGRMDTSTAPKLDSCIDENIEGVSELTFDLKELSYTSSAGLRVFLKAQKLMNRQGKMKLVNVQKDVMEIFEITGFTEILDIE